MSKKTKLEKILAKQRRTEQIALQLNPSTEKQQYTFSGNTKLQKENNIVTKAQSMDYKYVSRDLIQTFVLTALAIAAQLCVYYLVEFKHFQFKF